MTLIASDGLEYGDLAARLLDRPLDSIRNGNVRSYRRAGYGEQAVKAYYVAFDSACVVDPRPGSNEFAQRHQAGLRAASATGKFGPPHTWSAPEHDPDRI